MDIPGVTAPDQEEMLGLETPEEEEETTEVDIPEEEDEDTKITWVDQNIEYPEVNYTTEANKAMPGNPPGPIPTNHKNTPKVETVDDDSDTEED